MQSITSMAQLYPELDHRGTRTLDVGGGHAIVVHEAGNPAGKPAVVLHGGHGGVSARGCSMVGGSHRSRAAVVPGQVPASHRDIELRRKAPTGPHAVRPPPSTLVFQPSGREPVDDGRVRRFGSVLVARAVVLRGTPTAALKK